MKKFLSILIICIFLGGIVYVLMNYNNNSLPDANPSNSNSENSNNNNTEVKNSENENTNPPIVNKLRTEKAFAPLATSNYYIKLITDAEDDAGMIIKNATMEITVDGKNFATDIKDAGYGMIVKNDAMYYIMHEAKQYTKVVLQDATKQEMLNEFTSTNYNDKLVDFGEKELKGTKYYYESFNFDNETTVIYFDNENAKYIETQYTDGTPTTLIEIVEISNKTNSKLFEIPAGYTNLEI